MSLVYFLRCISVSHRYLKQHAAACLALRGCLKDQSLLRLRMFDQRLMIWANVTTHCGGLQHLLGDYRVQHSVQLLCPLSRLTTLILGLWKKDAPYFSTGCLFLHFTIPIGAIAEEINDCMWVSHPSWRIWSSFLWCYIGSVIFWLCCVKHPSHDTNKMRKLMWHEAVVQTTFGKNIVIVSRLRTNASSCANPNMRIIPTHWRASLQSCRVHFVLLQFVCRSSVVD